MKNGPLVKELIKNGYLKSPLIRKAFEVIDRKDFVPENEKKEAYENHPLLIGFGQTISQPLTVAFMLELLEPKVGEKILEVGAGSGWQAALLGFIAGGMAERNEKEKSVVGKVVTMERIQELSDFAVTNIEKYHFVSNGIVRVIHGNGVQGFPEGAPFDKIIAAAATETIPVAWKEQVRIGGRIVAPVNESIIVLDKVGPNSFSKRQYFGFNFVPLVME
ncbi:MAG: protein-L-isoaspartate O-methyltransferase [Candidatus Paceibacterota bacterium]|jgi:protein-L-isoaspartate(D-aspartate) O-methyltransferase